MGLEGGVRGVGGVLGPEHDLIALHDLKLETFVWE